MSRVRLRALRDASIALVYSLGAAPLLLRRRAKYHFVILTYHRVIPMEDLTQQIQSAMYVTPSTFELHLRFLKRFFRILPMSRIPELAHKRISDHGARPICFLTFDDGWHDLYQHGFPILKTHGIPATVFLPTDFIGREKSFWTDSLALLLLAIDKTANKIINIRESLSPLSKKVIGVKGSFQMRLEKAISLLKSCRHETIEESLDEISRRFRIEMPAAGRVFIGWDEAREMAESGLVSYGSHAAAHRILTTLSRGEIIGELKMSLERMLSEAVVEPSFIPFCYPNGNFTIPISEMVKEAGYHLAVTTERGWNHLCSNPYTLRRISIHQDVSATESSLAYRILI